MKRNKIWIIFFIVLAVGLFSINFLINWDKNSGIPVKVESMALPDGYSAKVVLKGLKNPAAIAVDSEGGIYVAENLDKVSRIVKYTKNGSFKVVCGDVKGPISQIILHRGKLYISHKGAVSMLEENGLVTIVDGLPSLGDYSNNGISFGYDGMIYICQGAATNSGVVGLDNLTNGWLKNSPYFHDYPPIDCALAGINFKTENPFSSNRNNIAGTGAFLPFNTASVKSEAIKGRLPATASIIRMTSYGGVVDTFAWGVRNPVGIVVLPDSRVFISNRGMELRGSRPVANGCDYLYEVKKNQWLGWPDYEGGEPIILKKFKPKNQNGNIRFIMELHPTLNPPKPVATFKESGRIGFIDTCSDSKFGYKGSIFIPLSKGEKEPAKIVVYDIKTGAVTDFATNLQSVEKEDNNVDNEEANLDKTSTNNFLEKPVQCLSTSNGQLFILENAKGVLIEVVKSSEDTKRILPGTISMEYFIGLIAASFMLCVLLLVIRRK